MQSIILGALNHAIDQLKKEQILPDPLPVDPMIERTREASHGDYASNLALLLAKTVGVPPRALAEKIKTALPVCSLIEKVDIAGPGFLNFFLSAEAYHQVLQTILEQKGRYGWRPARPEERIHIEFVSSNPTGPLHVGHGRGAAYGASLANILETQGALVHREYYVNDAGRQMDILSISIWLRYLELLGMSLNFPSGGYQGNYVTELAQTLVRDFGTQLKAELHSVYQKVPTDAICDTEGQVISGDKEAHLDALIANAKQCLGTNYRKVFDLGLHTMLADMKNDLEEFGVVYDEWFSEQSLIDHQNLSHCIEVLKKAGHLYKKEGALWFASSTFGDEKDRVVQRANGQFTYFASDIAYHFNKIERGFTKIIDVLGADHHGYVPRIRAVIKALTERDNVLTAPLVQFVSLYRGEKKLSMSTRAGDFITLRELREEVGNDAARFFYILRKADQHMDFDLQLAVEQSNHNPVYYVQYAHARIASVMRQYQSKYGEWQSNFDTLHTLTQPMETRLLKHLAHYPNTLTQAAAQHEPYLLLNYLRELAQDFHSYYNQCAFLVDECALREARLTLIKACQQVLSNGLQLLGVSTPEIM